MRCEVRLRVPARKIASRSPIAVDFLLAENHEQDADGSAAGFEHQAERIEPERREIGLRVLRKHLRLMHYVAAQGLHQAVNVPYRRAGCDHESQMLQPGTVARVWRCVTGRVEEQVRPRLARGGAEGEELDPDPDD